MNILKLINNVLTIINEVSGPYKNINFDLLKNLKLMKIENQNIGAIQTKFKSFLSNKSSNESILEFKVEPLPGVYFRIYRAKLDINNGKIVNVKEKAIAVYHRGRNPSLTHSRYELVGYLSKNIELKLDRHLQAYKQLKRKRTDSCTIPTLEGYLTDYEKVLYLKNPETVDRKINLIKSKFFHLLKYSVDEIKGKQLIEFVNSYRRKRTATQIQNDESPYSVEESTIKDWVCTLRAALKEASLNTGLFKCCDSLYGNSLKFKIDNDSDRYLNDEQLLLLMQSLKNRDDSKLKEVNNRCIFSDYLTPFILTSLGTGLRPKYALSLKWSDIDFDNNQIKVRSTKGKIKRTEWCPLTSELIDVLGEWRKHPIHSSNGNWLFPSPAMSGQHLVSYKTTFTTFRKKYGLNFVMYETRHTFATLVSKIYKNLQITQDLLHQKDSKSVKRYARVIKTERGKAVNQTSEEIAIFDKYLMSSSAAAVW